MYVLWKQGLIVGSIYAIEYCASSVCVRFYERRNPSVLRGGYGEFEDGIV